MNKNGNPKIYPPRTVEEHNADPKLHKWRSFQIGTKDQFGIPKNGWITCTECHQRLHVTVTTIVNEEELRFAL